MQPLSRQQKMLSVWLFAGFAFLIKSTLMVLCILIGVLVISQSSVAPVSTRLLSTYALEYATQTIKPYRHFFPKPYMIKLEKEQTR